MGPENSPHHHTASVCGPCPPGGRATGHDGRTPPPWNLRLPTPTWGLAKYLARAVGRGRGSARPPQRPEGSITPLAPLRPPTQTITRATRRTDAHAADRVRGRHGEPGRHRRDARADQAGAGAGPRGHAPGGTDQRPRRPSPLVVGVRRLRLPARVAAAASAAPRRPGAVAAMTPPAPSKAGCCLALTGWGPRP